MKFSKRPILLSLLLATALASPVCALMDPESDNDGTPSRRPLIVNDGDIKARSSGKILPPPPLYEKVANDGEGKEADKLLVSSESIRTTRLNSDSNHGTLTLLNLNSIEVIRKEAARLVNAQIFIYGTQDAISETRLVKTTLKKIFDGYDAIKYLASAASQQKGGIKKAISSNAFETLKKQEKALRKVISLIWGALMLKDDQDIETFKEAKSAPFLFNGTGFEGVSKEHRDPKIYSFSDAGNTDIHVAQIKAILESVGYNFETEISLPFHPIETSTRKKMARQYQEAHHQEPAENPYGFMFGYFKGQEVTPKAPTQQERSLSPIPSKGPDDTISLGSTNASINISLGDHGPSFITEEALMNAANHQKFMAIVNSEIGKRNSTYDIILKINNRLDPSESSEDKFNNPTFNDIAFGTTLKPITTGTYRLKAYTDASKALEEYWDKTEEILRKAEGIINGDMSVKLKINPENFKESPLSERAKKLAVGILWKIQKTERETSGLTKEALKKFTIPENSNYEPYYAAEINNLQSHITRPLMSPLSKRSVNDQEIFSSEDIRLNILSELTTELEKLL